MIAWAKPSGRSTPPRMTSNSTRSTSPTTRSSRRATAASSTASPISARCCRPEAGSSRCSTSGAVHPQDGGDQGGTPRIVLDARPDLAIPAKVAFRIRVKIDPERLRARGPAVRSGLPGVAYVKQDPSMFALEGSAQGRFSRADRCEACEGASAPLRRFLQQRLGLIQVERVEALSEPAVDGRE